MNATNRFHDNAHNAVQHATQMYQDSVDRLVSEYQNWVNGEDPKTKISENYPLVRIKVEDPIDISDILDAYGFCYESGIYEGTITRPDIMGEYYEDLFERLIKHHNAQIEVRPSTIPIPINFAVNELVIIDGEYKGEGEDPIPELRKYFDLPNWEHYPRDTLQSDDLDLEPYPLLLYNATRTDNSLDKIRYYTGTDASMVQNYILLTNYSDDIESFRRWGKNLMKTRVGSDDTPFKDQNHPLNQKWLDDPEDPIVAFIEPGNKVTFREGFNAASAGIDIEEVTLKSLPQMQALHAVRKSGYGVTLADVNVGAPNAINIIDQFAVLRPSFGLMMGHCAGLDPRQKNHDYIVPSAFIAMEKIYGHREVRSNIPIIDETKESVEDALRSVLKINTKDEFKRRVARAPITSTLFRTWEVPETKAELAAVKRFFKKEKPMALDMEGVFVAQELDRHRIPGLGFFRVSDGPLDGNPKMAGMSRSFRSKASGEQLAVGLQSVANFDERRREGRVPPRQLYDRWDNCPAR